jgi:hypothetical protein
VDHIDHFASVDINEDHVVVIPNPLIRAINRRQAIGPGIIDEVARLEEQAVEEEPDAQPVVTVRAIRSVVTAKAEDAPIGPAIIVPAEAAIRTPSAPIPAPEIAVVAPAAAIAEVAPCIVASGPYAIAKTVAPNLPILEPVALPFGADPIAETAPFGPIDLTIIAPVKAPVGLINPAIITPVDAAISLFEVPFAPAFNPVGPLIATLLNGICAAFAAAIHLLRGAIPALPFKAVCAPVTPVFDLVGTAFAPAINLLGALYNTPFLTGRARGGLCRTRSTLFKATVAPAFAAAILPVL